MGVCHDIACNTCKKRFELNKSRAAVALWYGYIEERCDDFGVRALFRFMRRHWGHEVELYSDCAEYGDDEPEWWNYEVDDVMRPPAQTRK